MPGAWKQICCMWRPSVCLCACVCLKSTADFSLSLLFLASQASSNCGLNCETSQQTSLFHFFYYCEVNWWLCATGFSVEERKERQEHRATASHWKGLLKSLVFVNVVSKTQTGYKWHLQWCWDFGSTSTLMTTCSDFVFFFIPVFLVVFLLLTLECNHEDSVAT